jgi:integrase
MAVYAWCTLCRSREEICSQSDSHRAQGKILWRADFLLGGRYGRRIRKTYPSGVTKKEVETYEAIAIADFARSKVLPQTGTKSKMLFPDVLDKYVDEQVSLYVKGAKREAHQFFKAREYWGNRPISSITGEDGSNYVIRRLKDKVKDQRKQIPGLEPRNLPSIKKTTVNRELGALKVFFSWCVTHKYILESPFSEVKKFEVKKSKKKPLSEKEIELLKQTAVETFKDPDLADIIDVGIDTGFREANLRDLGPKCVVGDRVWAFDAKSGDDYSVPLTARTKAIIQRRATSGEVRFLNFKNFKKRWNRLIQACGLYLSRGNPDNITLHSLKHTFVKRCLERGIPAQYVSKWANHHSVDFTLEHYWNPSDQDEAEQIRKLEAASRVDTSMTPKLSLESNSHQNRSI